QAGTYTLFQCSGTLTGAPANLSASVGGYTVTFAFNTVSSPRTVTMNIVGTPKNLVWTGQNSSDWDTTTVNWTNAAGATSSLFIFGDFVRFDDSSAQTSVNVTSPMLVGQTTVDAASTYTFTGGGAISGPGGLTKTGSGTLILDLNNDYAGITL